MDYRYGHSPSHVGGPRDLVLLDDEVVLAERSWALEVHVGIYMGRQGGIPRSMQGGNRGCGSCLRQSQLMADKQKEYFFQSDAIRTTTRVYAREAGAIPRSSMTSVSIAMTLYPILIARATTLELGGRGR